MTFNIHWCVDMDGNYNIKRIANVINEENPDVVGLQEVHCKTSLYSEDQAQELARLTSREACFYPVMSGCPTDPDGPGSYGLAILTRYKIEVSVYQPYPLKSGWSRSQEPRGALAVKLRSGMWFVNTHFGCDITGYEQAASAPLLDSFVETVCGKDTAVIVGDFNGCPIRSSIKKLRKKWVDAWTLYGKGSYFEGCTMPSWFPIERIDYIFIRQGTQQQLQVTDCRVSTYDKCASDHFAVICDGYLLR